MTLLALLALSLPSPAADLTRVKPKRLREEAVLSVTGEAGQVAVATTSGEVWVGERKLQQVGALDGPPAGLHASSGGVTAWTTRQEGLCVETAVHTWGPDGAELRASTAVGAPIAAARVDDRHALLWPARLELVPLDGGEVQVFPLPLGQPVGLSRVQGRLQVDAADGPLLVIDLEAGCPVGLEDDPALTPLERLRRRLARRVCGAPPHLPDAIEADAEVEQAVRLAWAIERGDPDALARLDGPDCAGLETHRPEKTAHESAFSSRFEREVKLDGRLQRGAGLSVVVRGVAPSTDLWPWVHGPDAPACHATLVLEGEGYAEAAWLRSQVEAASSRGADCVQQVLVAEPGDVGPVEDDEELGEVLYVLGGRSWVGVRRGAASARMVRLDLARLDPSDPLHGVAKAPELVPSWSVGPGPGGPILLDVDGSWVAGAGWDLLRGPPNAIRKERVSLPGPILRLQGRQDGRFEVVSGGGIARVALEDGRVEWAEQPASPAELLPVPDPLPPRPAVDPGPWRVVGDGRVGARGEQGRLTVDVGAPVQRVINGRAASVLVTPIGLLGLGPDGAWLWRLTEIRDFVFTGDFVVATSPWGVQGYRLPY